ncbi:MAG: tRNA pseudouridine(38-40) synthase TruA [Chitinophagaceae bacterium]|nr:MAG: tRNA pseudouridine(38-40) synthase TruA [Chitinophagaceae bacterium]
MPRYFIEVAYKGTHYAGFQIQQNANTIQAQVEKALAIYLRADTTLTGSSRTDAGVHAKQNFFHFDSDKLSGFSNLAKPVYHLNAILPGDIVVKSIRRVADEAHSRFDAISRSYKYTTYSFKDPFLQDTGFYYPFQVDINLLNSFAAELLLYTNFEAFSKRSTQVHTFNCSIIQSEWVKEENVLSYNVSANRFLRGMVKGLVGTMLRAAGKHHSVQQFKAIIESRNPSLVDFSVPSHGLCLCRVNYG